MAAVAEKLESEGYDLDSLTENGEGYEIHGHCKQRMVLGIQKRAEMPGGIRS